MSDGHGQRAIVLLVGLVLLAGCTTTTAGVGHGSAPSSGPGFPSPPATVTVTASSTSSAPSLADRDAQLTAQTNGEPHVIVPVPAGYQAVTYDQGGNLQFWADPEATTTWTQLGQSSYPLLSPGPPEVTLIAADLTGMANATYIAHGFFTGDGSGDWLAFAANSGGAWGVIKALSNGNIGPSGQPVDPANQIGLSYHLAFVGGDLQTTDCAPNVIIADCGQHEINKLWRWTGSQFVRAD